jgi:hypothetical protein
MALASELFSRKWDLEGIQISHSYRQIGDK